MDNNANNGRKMFSKEEVDILLKNRTEQTRKLFFSRYGVSDFNELDELVKIGEKSKRLIDKTTDFSISKQVDIQMDDLIGLDGFKKRVDRLAALIDKNKCLKITQSMNYVFLGNPGTGKTVAARALAKKFYDEGIIKENVLVEADRSTLIGEYLGQTSPKIKKLFLDALGGVLFIDEAYFLTIDEHYKQDYCFEALAMLNKLMEDYRGEIVVIFAGYKDETLKMLDGNKGLKSRINAYIDFPDYSEAELKEILLLIANKYKYTFDNAVVDKIVELVFSNRNKNDYANARDLRNTFEKIIEFQAYRTYDFPWDRNITMEDVIEYQKENGISDNADDTLINA